MNQSMVKSCIELCDFSTATERYKRQEHNDTRDFEEIPSDFNSKMLNFNICVLPDDEHV